LCSTAGGEAEILEGEPSISRCLRGPWQAAVKVPSLQVVILTYGKPSVQHGRRIAEAFPAAQVDLYGSTEAGYIFIGMRSRTIRT